MDYTLDTENVKRRVTELRMRSNKVSDSEGSKVEDKSGYEYIYPDNPEEIVQSDIDATELGEFVDVTSSPSEAIRSQPRGPIPRIPPSKVPPPSPSERRPSRPRPRPRPQPVPNPVPNPTLLDKCARRACFFKMLVYGGLIALFLSLVVGVGLAVGAATNCIRVEHNYTDLIDLQDATRTEWGRADNSGHYLSRYFFNFTTTNEYSIRGKRDVVFCRDVQRNGTLCDGSNSLARTMFIGAQNCNTTTNRLSREVYVRIQDLLNWTSGRYATNEGWYIESVGNLK